jgi:DNA adenine methylase
LSLDLNFLRYPGSKRRVLSFLTERLPSKAQILGKFVEPFVGGGAIYFCLQPRKAVLADLNRELVDIYLGICRNPDSVWRFYRTFPATKAGYRKIRSLDHDELSRSRRAASSLYLNRTCFKGMWRHNNKGRFNVGYGGQSRRWAISRKDLFRISELLTNAEILCSDFERTVSTANANDFVFLDPPYRPGAKEQVHSHYGCEQFSFADQQRLSSCLIAADKKGIRWSMTNSAHRAVRKMYKGFRQTLLPSGTGRRIGEMIKHPGEVLISNW